MNQPLTNEKYISIEYDLWNNKYLPMEEENKSLKQDLEKKTIYISAYFGETFYHRIGYADFTNDSYKINISNQEDFINDVYRHLLQREKWGSGSPLGRHYELPAFLSKSEAESIEYKLNSKKAEIDRSEQQLWEEKQKIEKIPFFIRWLFKIKV